MTTLAERVPLDDILTQAREAKPGRTALTLLAGLFFGIGWLSAKTFTVLWLFITWAVTAIRLGWKTSYGPSRADRMATLLAENEQLQAIVSRFGGP